MTKRILTGSRAFFSGMESFNPKDSDFIILVEKGNGFRHVRHIVTGKICLFIWVRRPKKELIEYALRHGAPMQVIKFLTPEFASEIDLQITDLSDLRPLIDRLDSKHAYARLIYEFYIQNGAFVLNDEQRAAAYNSYKESRS